MKAEKLPIELHTNDQQQIRVPPGDSQDVDIGDNSINTAVHKSQCVLCNSIESLLIDCIYRDKPNGDPER